MRKMFLSFVLSAFACSAFAQPALGIGAGRAIIGIQDTVCGVYTDVYSVYVKNKGNSAFAGVISLFTYVDSTGFNNFLPDGFPDTAYASLAPGDSVQMFHTHLYDSLNQDVFRMGGNIVVIWPSAQSTTTTDSSLLTPVYVSLCNSIAELADLVQLQIFPNPNQGSFMIRVGDIRFWPEKIRLLDTSGRELFSQVYSEHVTLKEYSDGLYFLELVFSDKSSRTYKIVRKE